MPLQEGQQVLIKNPRALVGTVVKARPGDKGLPEEQTHYLVRISDELFYLSTDLEAVENPNMELERYSPEWLAEFNRWLELGRWWLANQGDTAALAQFSESGRKLGFIVPMK